MREGQQALQLMPIAKDAWRGPFHVEEMARIYAMVGERDAAVEQLEYLMSIPFELAAPACGTIRPGTPSATTRASRSSSAADPRV